MTGADGAPAPPAALEADEVSSAFKAHAAELRQFLRRRLQCHETAADITQRAYLNLLVAPPAEPVQDKRAWLFRVARNLVVDHVRLRRRSAALEAGLQGLYAVTGDEQPQIEQLIIARETLEQLRTGMQELPEPTRSIFELSRLQGLARKDVAEQLGVSESTVAKHLALSLQFLRERLER